VPVLAAFVLVAVPAAFVPVAAGVAAAVAAFAVADFAGVSLLCAVFVAFAFEVLLLLQPTPTSEPTRIAPIAAPKSQFFAFMAFPSLDRRAKDGLRCVTLAHFL
jgi:hypothetical protein